MPTGYHSFNIFFKILQCHNAHWRLERSISTLGPQLSRLGSRQLVCGGSVRGGGALPDHCPRGGPAAAVAAFCRGRSSGPTCVTLAPSARTPTHFPPNYCAHFFNYFFLVFFFLSKSESFALDKIDL